jgi:hypothetical protein
MKSHSYEQAAIETALNRSRSHKQVSIRKKLPNPQGILNANGVMTALVFH